MRTLSGMYLVHLYELSVYITNLNLHYSTLFNEISINDIYTYGSISNFLNFYGYAAFRALSYQ